MKIVAAAGIFAMGLALAPALAGVNAAKVYADNCARCHGSDGKAHTEEGRKGQIPDFTQNVWKSKNSDAEIKDVISYGAIENPKMKAYKDKLSPAEIDALVGFVRGLK